MRRGVIYLGGSGRQLMDQSAATVADRIARSIEDKLQPAVPAACRVQVETDVHRLAPDIALDQATIEVATGQTWTPVLDLFEIKYLDHFARPFTRLSPLGRVIKAGRVLRAFHRERWCQRSNVQDRNQRELSDPDKKKAAYLQLVILGTIGSLIYWLAIGIAATLGLFIALDDLPGWMVFVVAIIVLAFEAMKRFVIETLDVWAAESLSGTWYQVDDRRFMAIPNAIVDAIIYARRQGCDPVDLLSFSLGSLLAADAIFPRRPCGWVRTPDLHLRNWITIGFPYDLIRVNLPNYFSSRQPRAIAYETWINVVMAGDFLGTAFAPDDGRGLRIADPAEVVAPTIRIGPLDPPPDLAPDPRLDWWPLRGIINHTIYWNEEDARAGTCFHHIADQAGWTAEVATRLQAAPSPKVDA